MVFDFMKWLLTYFCLISAWINICAQDLPPVNLIYSSYSLTTDGKVIGSYGDLYRVDIKSLNNISWYVVDCLISTEDRDFYNHDGVSVKGLVRGLWNTIKGHTQGGSTITMQLARNLYLTKEKTLKRKFTEIEIAYKIEKKYSKNEILALYLNTVYFGQGAHGIWAAAQTFFGKKPKDLNLVESATLVGLLQSPTNYDPEKNPARTLARRNEVLDNLVEVGKMSERECSRLKRSKLNITLNRKFAGSFNEYVRREAEDILRKKGLRLNNGQYIIYTTLDGKMQSAAEDAVKWQYSSFNRNMKSSQIGLISLDPFNGMIKAMVGSNPYSEPNGLNHAVQIRRQPGSAFKIFLYGELLKEGFTLAEPLADKPVTLFAGTKNEWSPSNSEDVTSNKEVPMFYAMEKSINLAAVDAVTHLTTPDSVINFAKTLGVKSNLLAVPSIVLGTSNVSPMEMAVANSVIASGGYLTEPYAITKIEDKNGRTIYYHDYVSPVKVLDEETTSLLTYGMQKVVNEGTAKVIRRYYSGPAAGKTGTTQSSTDAWFTGFTPTLSTTIWVGFDNPKNKLSGAFQYGGTAAAPIFGKMMAGINYHYGDFPKRSFKWSQNIQEREICLESGELATDKCLHKMSIPVNINLLPGECSLHGNVVEKFDIHRGW